MCPTRASRCSDITAIIAMWRAENGFLKTTLGQSGFLCPKSQHFKQLREKVKVKRSAIPCSQKDCWSNSSLITESTAPELTCSHPLLRRRKISLYPTRPSARFTKMPERKQASRGEPVSIRCVTHWPHIFWKLNTTSEKYRF
jgi:hypothetical protein